MFPAAVVAMTKILPSRLHVTSITFAAAVAGAGACVFPFVVGAVAQKRGVGLLRWFVIAMLGGLTVVWVLGVPRIGGRDGKGREDEKSDEEGEERGKRWWKMGIGKRRRRGV